MLSTPRINLLYWDFEAFLSAVGSALDILARVVGPAYEEQAPVSFNRLCSKQNLAGPANVFRSAKAQWVNRLKDYRDCFVHYTPADTRGWLRIVRWADGWEVRGRLPVNPNVRDIFAFRFSRRVDMLPYCLVTLRHLATFEKRVATTLWNVFREGHFPKRTRHPGSQGLVERGSDEDQRVVGVSSKQVAWNLRDTNFLESRCYFSTQRMKS